MTHNFDFFRTIRSRFVVEYSQCVMASKSVSTGALTLDRAVGLGNVFKEWKGGFFNDTKKKIACIPFLRNLIEFAKGTGDANYLTLTALLHWKPAVTPTITVGNLDAIFSGTCSPGGPSPNPADIVGNMIFTEAAAIAGDGNEASFEDKVILAIAIRLTAEKFMIAKINNAAFVAAITGNQTAKLIAEFKRLFPTDAGSIRMLDRVSLMTPENIHLNSFMYEPIIDMAGDHLKRLYTDVAALR